MVIHHTSLPDPLAQVNIEDSIQYSNIRLLTEDNNGKFVPAYLEAGVPLKETDYLINSQYPSPSGVFYDKNRKTFIINSVPNIGHNVVFQIKVDKPPPGYTFFLTNQSSMMREAAPCEPCYLYIMEPAGSMGDKEEIARFYLKDELSLQFYTLVFAIKFVAKRPIFSIDYTDLLVNVMQGTSMSPTTIRNRIPPDEIVVSQLTNHNDIPVWLRLKAPRDFQLQYNGKNFGDQREIDISIPDEDGPATRAYEHIVKIELIEEANPVNKHEYLIRLRFNEG